MTTKLKIAQVAQLQKLASLSLTKLAGENKDLRAQNAELTEKIASFEKKARAEKIATAMESKGINPDSSFAEKVSELMQRDNLDVVEEAVGLAAPQMKLASVAEDSGVEVETTGDMAADAAANRFAASLASLEG